MGVHRIQGHWSAGIALFLFLLCATISFADTFTASVLGNYDDVTVMEVEGNYDAPALDCVECGYPRRLIANEFYKTHPDDYDFIVIFSNFDFQMPRYEIAGEPAVAAGFYHAVRNDTQGVGKRIFDNSALYGSQGRLQGTIDMGPLAENATDSLDPDFSYTMRTLSHEILHRWAAYVGFMDQNGTVNHTLLGSDDAHWSYLLDTDGSLMYGNNWQDNGDGTFTALPGRKYYSPLDLYLMGLIDRSEVPPMLLIDNPDTNPEKMPEPGATISGTARIVTIDDIIAAEGERIPSVAYSQKSFKIGTVLLVRPGTYKDADLWRAKTVVQHWVLWFSALTDGRAKVVPDVAPLQSLPSNPGISPPVYDPREGGAKIQDGVDWLIANQEESGCWLDSFWTDQRDTTFALWALENFSGADTNRSDGIQWMSASAPGNIDYLAKKIRVLAGNGEDYTTILNALIKKQNLDGGWGMEGAFGSNPLDTAFVLTTLSAVDFSEVPVLTSAIEYLKQTRNIDNGWGSNKGISDIRTTTSVLSTFTTYNPAFGLDTWIQDGVSWLYSRQNPDGGFGNSPSTIYDTAMSLLLLRSVEASVSTAATNALTYILKSQSADGSWHESAYQTALAVNALWAWRTQVHADLWIGEDDLTVTPSSVTTIPVDVVVRATVHNNGINGDVHAVVRLYDGVISDATVVGEQSITVPEGGGVFVEFPVHINDGVSRRFIVYVDPDNTIEEPVETNNIAYRTLENYSCTGPELKITYEEVSFTPAKIRTVPGTHVVDAVIHNTGAADADAFKLGLYRDAPEEANKVAEQTVSVPAKSSAAVSLNLEATSGQTQYLYLVVDSGQQVIECNESNNLVLKILHVDDTKDFEILDTEVAVSPAVVNFGEPVQISVTIRNRGAGNAYSVPVKYYVNGREVASTTVDLTAGASVVKNYTWTADEAGEDLVISVKVDPDNFFTDELFEDNNSGSAAMTVNPLTIPNLAVFHENVHILPDPLLEAGSGQITAVVENNGFVPVDNVKVNAYLGLPGHGGILIGSADVPSLNNNESQGVTISWPVINASGRQIIYINATSQDGVPEVRDDDNETFVEVDILRLPDLVVTPGAITFAPSSMVREGEPLTVHVIVQNTGDQYALNVPVVLYENGVQLGESIILSIPGNSQGAASFSYDTTGKTGTHEIRVIADEQNAVLELNEQNNTASKSFSVQNADLYVSERYFSPNGDGSKDDTTLFFELESERTVFINIADGDNSSVRTFSGEAFENTGGGSATWDGLNEKGMVVPDGEYWIQVMEDDGSLIAESPVVVDKNMSPITEAIPQALLHTNLTCELPDIQEKDWRWFSDESGILFYLSPQGSGEVYPNGLYTMPPDGSDTLRLTPWSWQSDADAYISYTYDDYSLSPDEENILFTISKYQKTPSQLLSREIWRVDRYGQNLTNFLADSEESNGPITHPLFSPDQAYISYIRSMPQPTYHYALFFMASESGDVELVDESERSFENIKWHPDNATLAYVKPNEGSLSIMTADPSGTSQEVFLSNATQVESLEWLGNDKLLLLERIGNGYYDDNFYNVWLLDTTGGQNHIQIAGNLEDVPFGGKQWKAKVEKNPDNNSFAFINSLGERWQLKVCDAQGNCRVLYESFSTPGCSESFKVALDDLQWSPDGTRIAVVEYRDSEATANPDETDSPEPDLYQPCEYDGDVIVLEAGSGEVERYDLFRKDSSIDPQLSSFHASALKGDTWEPCGVLHFGDDPEIQWLDITDDLPITGSCRMQIEQRGMDDASVGLIGLRIDGDFYYWPDSVVNTTTGEDIREKVTDHTQPFKNMISAHGVLFDLTWEHLPESFEKAELVMAGQETEYFYSVGTLQWIGNSTLIYNGTNGNANGGGWPEVFNTLILDLGTQTQVRLPLNNDNSVHSEISPLENFITYEKRVETGSLCYGMGLWDTWSVTSLLNLTAILHASVIETGVLLKGTAVDRHFESYVLEYARAENPEQWNLIAPPSETPVVNDEFINWVPPGEGVYYVRLTVADKAGNRVFKKRRITWGYQTSIANLYKTAAHFTDTGVEFIGNGDYISPHTDSRYAALALHYRVLEPVHLEFAILDETGNVISNIYKQYPNVDGLYLEDYVTWDGRDNSGNIVPEGRYCISVLSYKFFFEVDRTAPETDIQLHFYEELLESDAFPLLFGSPTEFSVKREIRADDKNNSKWTESYSPMDAPEQWTEYASGTLPDEAGLRSHSSEAFWYSSRIEEAVMGKLFKITSEDLAGNISLNVASLPATDENVLLNRLKISSDIKDMFQTVWEGFDVSSFAYPEFFERSSSLKMSGDVQIPDFYNVSRPRGEVSPSAPEIYLSPGVHKIQAVDMLHAPIEQATLQYAKTTDPSAWMDAALLVNPDPWQLEFEWDTSNIDHLESIYGIRIKAIDTYGISHYSNIVPFVPYMVLGYDCGKGLQYHMLGLPGEKLTRLRVVVNKRYSVIKEGKKISRETGYQQIVYDPANGDPVPEEETTILFSDIFNRFALFGPEFQPGYGEDERYTIQLVGETQSEKLCVGLNEIVHVLPCDAPPSSQVRFSARSQRDTGSCNRINTNEVRLTADFDARQIIDGIFNPGDMQSVSFYVFDGNGDIVDEDGDSLRLLETIDFISDPIHWEKRITSDCPCVLEKEPDDISLEDLIKMCSGGTCQPLYSVEARVNTEQLPEGTWPMKVVCEYGGTRLKIVSRHGGSNNTTIKSDPCIKPLVVDRQLPLCEILWPEESAHICPVQEQDAEGNVVVSKVSIEVAAEDDNAIQQYAFSYEKTENPGNWHNVLFFNRTEDKCGTNTPSSVHGSFGEWNVRDLPSGTYRLKLEVTDVAGNVSCHTTGSFYLDAGTRVNASVSPSLFSPNGDGLFDYTDISVMTEEPAQIGIELFDMDDNLVAAPVTGHASSGGKKAFSWGDPSVEDGRYRLQVKATDVCNNSATVNMDVTIDKTPPDLQIGYPQPGDPMGVIVNLTGVADDLHFQDYTLEATSVDDPDTTILIVQKTNPVQMKESLPGHLGTWNTFGLEGSWQLLLSARDTVGNSSQVTTVIDLGDRLALIKDLARSPILISPNNDGRLDATTVSYELNPDLNENFDVAINIVDTQGAVASTHTMASVAPGTHHYGWDGTTSSGGVAPDGRYTIRLTAAVSSNTAITQTEATPVIVDVTPPEINVSSPQADAHFKATVDLAGTIADTNIRTYAITCTGPAGTIYEDQGSQVREEYHFTTFFDLEEGVYILNIQADDQGENTSEQTRTFTIDKTPPEVSLQNPVDGDVFGADGPVNISGTIVEDNPSFWKLRYGAGEDPAQWIDLIAEETLPVSEHLYEWDTAQVEDGTYTLSLYAVDKAGWETETRIQISIDNTPPVVEITSPQDNGYVTETLNIRGTAADLHFNTYSVTISQGDCATANQWSTVLTWDAPVQNGSLYLFEDLPADGAYCLKVTATDTMGNTTQETVGFVVDTVPPAPPVLFGQVENKMDAMLSWDPGSEPDLAGYNLYRAGAKINTGLLADASYVDAGLADGLYTYTLTAVDLAGLESDPSNTVELKIDNSGPTVRIASPADGAVINDLSEIKGTAYSVDDFKEYRVFFGEGADPAVWNLVRKSPVAISYGVLAQFETALTDGTTSSIRLEAEDIHGNMNTHQVAFSIDSQSPAPPVLLSLDENGSDVTATWELNTEPDIAGYLLYRNNVLVTASGTVPEDLRPFLVAGPSYGDTGLPDGTFTYFLEAMDRAGNISGPSNTLEVDIDTRAPHATITAPADGHRFDVPLTVVADTPDLDIATVQFQYKPATGTEWTDLGDALQVRPFTVVFNPAAFGLGYGDYQIRAVASDGKNTDPAPSAITVTCTDITPPAVPSGLTVHVNGEEVTLFWAANTENDLAGYNVYWCNTYGGLVQINTEVVSQAGFSFQEPDNGAYAFSVTAVDASGNESDYTEPVSATIYALKLDQPFTPTAVDTVALSGISLNPDDTIEITVNEGVQHTTTSTPSRQFTYDLSLLPGENHIVARAVDTKGNTSKPSDPVIVVYNEAPAPPIGLDVVATDTACDLSWNANTEADIFGYYIYRDGVKLNEPALAGSGTATASVSDWQAAKAVDHNSSTSWESRFYPLYGDFVWWQLTLSAHTLISRIEIDWGSSETSGRDFEVQVWSGYAWIPYKKVKNNTDSIMVVDFDRPYGTDRFRILITDANGLSPYSYDTDARVAAIAEVRVEKENPVSDLSYMDADLSVQAYQYQVSAVDVYGFESRPCEPVTATAGDITPPAPPQNLTATENNGGITLNWSANTEPDLAAYNIYFRYDILSPDWQIINSVPAGQNSCTLLGFGAINGLYYFRITAMDMEKNESNPSNEAMVTVTTGPLAPQNLTATVSGSSVVLSWTPSGDADVIGYFVLTETASGWQPANGGLVTETTYTVASLPDGTYSFMVLAVNSENYTSAPSNRVTVEITGSSGGPSALLPPVITDPDPALSPIETGESTVDILGTTELGLNAELYRNGNYVQTVAAGGVASVEFIIPPAVSGGGVWDICVSADGRYIAYTEYLTEIDDSWSIQIMDTETGDKTVVAASYPYSLQWAPHTHQILYSGIVISSTQEEEEKLFIYDVDTGVNTQVEGTGNPYEYEPAWSFDGTRIVFVSTTAEWADDIWVKNLLTGELTQVTHNPQSGDVYFDYPTFSPDGDHVAYVRYAPTTDALTLNIMNLETGNEIVAAVDIVNFENGISYAWSPKDNQIAYMAHNEASGGTLNFYLYDMTTWETAQLTAMNGDQWISSFSWYPDGSRLVYANSLYDSSTDTGSSELRSIPINTPGQGSLLAQWDQRIDCVSISRSDDIWYGGATDENLVLRKLSQGNFIFEDVTLEAGENEFAVLAVDGEGNRSDFSDPVILIFDPTLSLPDLSVSGTDIFIQPLSPLNGEKMTGSVLVRNTGALAAQNAEVEICVVNPNGYMEPVKSTVIGYLAPGAKAQVSFSWNSAGNTGTNLVLVDVDPLSAIDEADEWNNTAYKRFIVVDEYGITMETELNADTYDAGEFVMIFVDISNSDAGRAASLDVRVEDGAGNVVDDVETLSLYLPYGYSGTQFMVWPAVDVYAGDYRVVSVLSDASGIIKENRVPFTLLPVIGVDTVISTDRTVYGTSEDVLLDIQTTNTGITYIPALSVRVRITDDAGNEVYAKEEPVVNLMGGVSVSLDTLWNTGLSTPGTYTAIVETYIDGDMVASDTSSFTIHGAPVISGTMAVVPSLVIPGNEATAGFSITNSGNADAIGLPVDVVVYDSQAGEIVYTDTRTMDLGIGEIFENEITLATDTYGLRTYTVMLQAEISGAVKTLASGSLTVRDGTAPVVTVVSPADGGVYTSNFHLTVDVNDRFSGIGDVEYSTDGGDWLPIPLADPSIGRYSKRFVPTEADEGVHVVRFRAVDLRGNLSTAVPVNITIAPAADITASLNAEQFGMNADVSIGINLINIGWEKTLTVDAFIETADGVAVATFDPVSETLGYNESASHTVVWNTTNTPAGDYQLKVVASRGETAFDEAAVPFIIDPVVAVAGSLTVTPSAVPAGGTVQTDGMVTNTGNLAITGATVSIAVIDPDTLVVQSNEATVDLAIGATHLEQALITTDDLGIKAYTVVLDVVTGDETHRLASGSFTVTDATPPAVTIISPADNGTYSGPFDISAAVTDDASGVAGVEYRMDDGPWQALPLTDPAGIYATPFIPTGADEGPHTISFRASDHAGNTSSPVSVSIFIESFKAFKELTGMLEATPDPVMQGTEVTLVYSVNNSHPDELTGLAIVVEVIDPDTGETLLSFDRILDLPANMVIGADFKEVVDLEPGTYEARLVVAIDAPVPVRDLDATSFEVISKPDIEMDKQASGDDIRLLVWVNDNCHIECNGLPLLCVDDVERGDSLDGVSIGCLTDCQWKDCIRGDLLEQVLEQTVADYTIVYDEQAFADRLRSPYFTDVLILGTQQHLGCGTLAELTERVNAGMGVVATLWYQYSVEYDLPFLTSIFGVTWSGLPMICGYDLTTVASPITDAGAIDATGNAWRVGVKKGTTIAGWLKPRNLFGSIFNIAYPAIVLNQYGAGKTIYYAFDLGLTLNDENYEQIGGLIADSIAWTHDNRTPEQFLPWQMTPVHTIVESSNGDFVYRLTETFPEDLALFDPHAGQWATESPWQVDIGLETDEPATIRYFYLMPDAAGTYATATELGIVFNDAYVPLDSRELSLTVRAGTPVLIEEAISGVKALSVPWWKKLLVRSIVDRLENVRERDINSRNDIDANIGDILTSVHWLMALEPYTDITAARLKLDDLLAVQQRLYFLYE